MTDVAVRVHELGKQFRIGRDRGYKTLRESLVSTLTAPIRRSESDKRSATEAFWALRDVSFDIEHGQVVGIIGRNGAGKSTLLKILSRITEPTSGRVEITGRVGSLLEVGTGFHPELTGRENIYMNGSILGMRRREIERKFDEIVAFSEVEKFLDTPVKRYSSGMYMRLAFSVAAHLEPEVLIVDEVLAVGDAQFQKKCLGKMGDVARQGRTVLFVSHNMPAVEKLCGRGIVLREGQVVYDGDPRTAIRTYLDSGTESATDGVYVAPKPDASQPRPPVRIVGATVRSDEQFETGVFPIDVPLEITMDCELTEELSSAIVGVRIDSFKGTRVTTFHTACSAVPFSGYAPKGRVRFRCSTERLPLTPGRYFCRLEIVNNMETVALVEGQLAFTVEPTDYFGNGGKRLSDLDVIVCRQRWATESL
jgi:lipopolysaccharide transport system ATP-binding protein